MGSGLDESKDDVDHSGRLSHVVITNISVSAGNTIRSTPHPSDTCPCTYIILNQNINGLGGKNQDKLK